MDELMNISDQVKYFFNNSYMKKMSELYRYSIEELYKELVARKSAQLLGRSSQDSSLNNKLEPFDSLIIIDTLRKKQEQIYGRKENRLDHYQIKDQRILDNIDSVVSIFSDDDLLDKDGDTSELQTGSLGTAYDLCPNEIFSNQPVGPYCSGFLVSPQIVSTTAHCIGGIVENARFVFGFRMNSSRNPNLVINNSEIYKGRRIVGSQLIDNGIDWALVELDRPVVNHQPLQIRRDGKLEDGAALYVMGHPCGLPVKFAANSHVISNGNFATFTANLDIFGGYPGSPVFNVETHQVEGMVALGQPEFVSLGNCYVPLICPDIGCSGFLCARTTLFSHLL
jgi:hypothetical protein